MREAFDVVIESLAHRDNTAFLMRILYGAAVRHYSLKTIQHLLRIMGLRDAIRHHEEEVTRLQSHTVRGIGKIFPNAQRWSAGNGERTGRHASAQQNGRVMSGAAEFHLASTDVKNASDSGDKEGRRIVPRYLLIYRRDQDIQWHLLTQGHAFTEGLAQRHKQRRRHTFPDDIANHK